jgi:hypothetical protein
VIFQLGIDGWNDESRYLSSHSVLDAKPDSFNSTHDEAFKQGHV